MCKSCMHKFAQGVKWLIKMIFQNFNEYVTCAYDGKGGRLYVGRTPANRHSRGGH